MANSRIPRDRASEFILQQDPAEYAYLYILVPNLGYFAFRRQGG